MSEIFEGYERQYCELSTHLARKTSNAALLSGEPKKQKLQELQNGLQEAESLIRRMDLEARTLPPTQKATLLSKLREYKADLNNLKRETKKSSAPDAAAERAELLENGLGGDLSNSADQRSRLLSNTARLQESSDRLQQGKRTLLETEDLGLHGADDNISTSRQILNNMGRRMARNKLIMGFIIFILLAAIALVLYVKLRSRR
eukprot:jgi/Mesen1/1819/ME000141S00983